MIIQEAKCDTQKFAPLYDKYYKEIFLFIYKRTDEEALTGDITSQVFLKVLNNLTHYKAQGLPFSSWLYRIASNEVNQHFRDNSKAKRVISVEDKDISDVKQEMEEDHQMIEQEHLIDMLDELDNQEVELIEMRFFEKRPFKEIGEILSITENNAKVKVYRILDKLKKLLQPKLNIVS